MKKSFLPWVTRFFLSTSNCETNLSGPCAPAKAIRTANVVMLDCHLSEASVSQFARRSLGFFADTEHSGEESFQAPRKLIQRLLPLVDRADRPPRLLDLAVDVPHLPLMNRQHVRPLMRSEHMVPKRDAPVSDHRKVRRRAPVMHQMEAINVLRYLADLAALHQRLP